MNGKRGGIFLSYNPAPVDDTNLFLKDKEQVTSA